jgi:dihydroxyacid dehydratase/phosphogluconate dehydratase
VKEGDLITLDIPNRRLELKVYDVELARRRELWKKPAPRYLRGWGAMFANHVTQADKGCDFDFLEGTSAIDDPEIH